MFVFVYGTLKKGHLRDTKMLFKDAEFFKNGTLEGHALMYSQKDTFPYIIPKEGSRVKGEIWGLPESDLPYLDQIEGVQSGLYSRNSGMISGVKCIYYVGEKIHQMRKGDAKECSDWTVGFENAVINKLVV